MVNFVNSLVERTPVESTVREVVPGVLHHKKYGDLISHGPDGGEGNGGGETEELGHRVEEPEEAISLDQRLATKAKSKSSSKLTKSEATRQ